MSGAGRFILMTLVLVVPVLSGCTGEEGRGGHVNDASNDANVALASPVRVETPIGAIVAMTKGPFGSTTGVFLADQDGRIVAVDPSDRSTAWVARVMGAPVDIAHVSSSSGPRVAVFSHASLVEAVASESRLGQLLGDAAESGRRETPMAVVSLLDAETGELVERKVMRSSRPVALSTGDVDKDGTDDLFLAHKTDEGRNVRITALSGRFTSEGAVSSFVPRGFGDPDVFWWFSLGGVLRELEHRDQPDGPWLLVGTSAALYMITWSGDRVHLLPEDAQDMTTTAKVTVVGGRNGLVAMDDRGALYWDVDLPAGPHRVAAGAGPDGPLLMAAWSGTDGSGVRFLRENGTEVANNSLDLDAGKRLQVRPLDVDADGVDEWLVEATAEDGAAQVLILNGKGDILAEAGLPALDGPVVVMPGVEGPDLWLPGQGTLSVLSLVAA
ncbi:MAG: hypothetical protein KY455_09375 [Euryarchaeota archaeon]|nr:hypothetical protein [Euryarchaeota archaeon]